jgi:hypothetical protein
MALMTTELQDFIRDAHLELRKAAGQLSPEEQEEELRKAAVSKLQGFVLRKLGVTLPITLDSETAWTEKGPVAIFKAEGRVVHLRKAGDNDTYMLFLVEGDSEREIARIEGSDQLFASRFLVAVGDVVS